MVVGYIDNLGQGRTEWGVLPEGNEKRTDVLLDSATEKLKERGGIQIATDIVREMMEDEEVSFRKGLEEGDLMYASQACTLAHFTDRALQMR